MGYGESLAPKGMAIDWGEGCGGNCTSHPSGKLHEETRGRGELIARTSVEPVPTVRAIGGTYCGSRGGLPGDSQHQLWWREWACCSTTRRRSRVDGMLSQASSSQTKRCA